MRLLTILLLALSLMGMPSLVRASAAPLAMSTAPDGKGSGGHWARCPARPACVLATREAHRSRSFSARRSAPPPAASPASQRSWLSTLSPGGCAELWIAQVWKLRTSIEPAISGAYDCVYGAWCDRLSYGRRKGQRHHGRHWNDGIPVRWAWNHKLWRRPPILLRANDGAVGLNRMGGLRLGRCEGKWGIRCC